MCLFAGISNETPYLYNRQQSCEYRTEHKLVVFIVLVTIRIQQKILYEISTFWNCENSAGGGASSNEHRPVFNAGRPNYCVKNHSLHLIREPNTKPFIFINPTIYYLHLSTWLFLFLRYCIRYCFKEIYGDATDDKFSIKWSISKVKQFSLWYRYGPFLNTNIEPVF